MVNIIIYKWECANLWTGHIFTKSIPLPFAPNKLILQNSLAKRILDNICLLNIYMAHIELSN
jgi:hypothetical protein